MSDCYNINWHDHIYFCQFSSLSASTFHPLWVAWGSTRTVSNLTEPPGIRLCKLDGYWASLRPVTTEITISNDISELSESLQVELGQWSGIIYCANYIILYRCRLLQFYNVLLSYFKGCLVSRYGPIWYLLYLLWNHCLLDVDLNIILNRLHYWSCWCDFI